jgi:NhaP-type Na+/H+ and K+/H+ antiporter
MRPYIARLALCLSFLAPFHAQAADVITGDKSPLSYPLKQYGFVLGMALLGGFVNWYSLVRKGELSGTSITALVGELTTSALAGLLAFFVCEWLGISPLLTGAVVGITGHMGTRALALGEEALKRKVNRETDK